MGSPVLTVARQRPFRFRFDSSVPPTTVVTCTGNADCLDGQICSLDLRCVQNSGMPLKVVDGSIEISYLREGRSVAALSSARMDFIAVCTSPAATRSGHRPAQNSSSAQLEDAVDRIPQLGIVPVRVLRVLRLPGHQIGDSQPRI